MNAIFYDEVNHRHTVEGHSVLSVTQYLQLEGCVDIEWCTEEGRARGQAVHAVMGYFAKNGPNDLPLHPIIQPYVAAGKLFLAETGFVPRLVEHIVYDPIYGVIGKLDLTGTWNLSDGLILIDWKTGDIEPYVALQTAAYAACLPEPHRRFALQLKADGTYRLSKEYTDRNDIKVFRSKVVSVNWNIKHGLLVPDEALAA